MELRVLRSRENFAAEQGRGNLGKLGRKLGQRELGEDSSGGGGTKQHQRRRKTRNRGKSGQRETKEKASKGATVADVETEAFPLSPSLTRIQFKNFRYLLKTGFLAFSGFLRG